MNELLSLNVNQNVEKKNGLSYLSWAWAWAEALKHDHEATWHVHTYAGGEEPFMRVGKTAMVHVSVTLKNIRRECMLPVMDHRNKAIVDPDAFAVNTAIMRCMTKALSMHGLGLYIYAGEDLPEGAAEPTTDAGLTPALEASIEQAKQKRAGVMGAVLADIHLEPVVMNALSKLADRVTADAAGFDLIEEQGLDGDEQTYLWSLLDSKKRSALKRSALNKLSARVTADAAGFDLIEEQGLDGDEKTYLWSLLDSKKRSALKREKDTRSMMSTTKETA